MSLDINVEHFYLLLRGHAFENVDISQKVRDYILKASLPINTQLVPLIKEYVNSIFYSPQVHALSEESIADTLSQRVKVTASQVILLFYVLYYNESIPPQSTTEFPGKFLWDFTYKTHSKSPTNFCTFSIFCSTTRKRACKAYSRSCRTFTWL
ncbi:hypothetical protein BC943DRAFT_12907 [Umbelopsis sp. AD052]|nr:hypothetical protein BC943DRAFT_12907 [Umbelopsis sp. AD052]